MLYTRQVPHVTQNTFSNMGTTITKLPATLLKALVRMSLKGLWWLIDTGNFAKPTPTLCHELFHSYIHDNTILNPCCFSFIDIPSSYAPLLHDIQQGMVWLISDGSYNPTSQHGTAARLLEGTMSTLQISGRVITPSISQ